MEMGTRGFILTLTNVSNHSCTLYGYPGLQLLNAKLRSLPTRTLWGMTYFRPEPGQEPDHAVPWRNRER